MTIDNIAIRLDFYCLSSRHLKTKTLVSRSTSWLEQQKNVEIL